VRRRLMAIRSGVSLKFKDPGLTALQVAVALAMVSCAMYFADAARGALLMLYPAIMLVGVLRLGTRELLGSGTFALACYGAVIVLSHRYKPAISHGEAEWLQWAVLGGILAGFALLGGHLDNLRRKIHGRNLQLQSALATIQEMVTGDELTGAYNRRYLMDRLEREESRNDRGGKALCVCVMDIDFFKTINDQHGHVAGDAVLRTFVAVAQADLRAADCLARYSADEFVLLLPGTPLAGAAVMVNRIRRRLEKTAFAELGAQRVTASFGVAQYQAPEDISTTLVRADNALRRAKSSGRNRVECAGAAHDRRVSALDIRLRA
jgi:diguanylate cyclase (GGDEF)-like protein